MTRFVRRVAKRTIRCTLTFAGSPHRVTAKLLRGRKVVARASGRTALVFKARGRLRAGRYTLVVGGKRLRVTVRR